MASYRPGGGGGNGVPCPPPSAEERRLLELLERAPSERFTAILKCIPGWQFEGQANLRNWETVLEKLKSQLVTAIEQCPRLLVVAPPPPPVAAVNGKEDVTNTATANDAVMSDDDERQLTEQVYETLRFSAILLENASNKHLYSALESVVALMGARDENVALEATHVFATLALLPQQHRHAVDPMAVQVDSPASSNATLRRRLLALAQGYGTAQGSSVDDFLAPLVEKLATPSAEDVRRQLGDAPLYQFYRQPQTSASDELVVVKLNQLSLELLINSSGSAALAGTICEQLIETWSVPVEDQFQLLVRLRSVVSAVRPTRSAESITVERLHALLALFYLFGDSLDVATLVEQHPGLARGLTELVRVENNDEVALRVRVTALHVLTALVYDRTERGGSGGILGRQSNVLQALGVAKGSPHGAFPSLVRFAMSELGQMAPRVRSSSASSTATSSMAPANDETDADPNDMDMSLAVAFVQATSDLITPEDAQVLRVGLFRDPLHPQESKLCWIEAVLVLLNQVVSMQSGAAVLTESGVIPALLHVASSPASSPFHISLITLCIQALETTINTHASAAALYRELNGVGMIIDRLQTEIAAPSVESVSETTTVLIIALLVMLSVSFHSQGVMSAGATSRVIRDGSPLSKALIKILSSIDLFGPVVFAQAAIVVSDIVNNDPSSVNQVHAGGIADAFLKTLTRWNVAELRAERILPPSSELIMAIPSVLSALCLTSAHAEKVARFKPLLYLLDCFVMPAYAGEDCDHLHGDTAAIVGSGVFEMMRQVTGFQTAAIQACVEATKKLIRFGDECQLSATRAAQKTEENYNTLLRMATHLNDVLEPILSKPEHASSFSDHGGVQYLLHLYRLILPTAPAFLSSLLTARSGNKAGRASLMTHQPAAQSITVALRSFASQQPPKMLSAIMTELTKQLDELLSQRGDVGGLISSLPDVELAELFNDNGVKGECAEKTSERSTKLQGISQYLRQLAFIEWQVGLLTWTMQTAQTSLQSRHWFSEFLSTTNTATLEKLFAVSRGVQLERASLTAGHRTSGLTPSDKVAASSLDGNKIKGLWKLCSLLLLRFSSVTRNLLVKMSTTFVSTPIQHRRAEDTVHPLAMHAHSLARLVASTLRADIEFVFSNTGDQACRVEDDFVKKYYLIFVLETVMQAIFDAKKKQANALVLHKLVRSETPVGSTLPSSYSCLHTMAEYLTNDCFTAIPSEGENTAGTRMREMCIRACSSALQHLGDLETLRTSQLTVSLAADDAASATMEENDRFDLRKLSVQLHRECLDLVLRLWQHPDVRVAPVQKYAQELLPAVVMILRHRLDLVDASDEVESSGLDPLQQRLRDRGRRRELGNPFGDFPGATGSLLDRDDLIQALFGGIGQPGRAGRPAGASRPFEVDSATVDSLVAMGFPRRRVERAIRRVRLNDVEVVMEWLLSHPDAEGEDDDDDDDEAEQAGNANAESTETGPESSAAGAQGDDPMAASPAENPRSEDEKALYEGYAILRAGFEGLCFGILRHQASVSAATASSPSVDASKDPATYELQSFVITLAQYFALLSSKVGDERQKVTGCVSDALLRAMSNGETEPDRYIMMLAHLLAVMLQLDAGSADTLTKQDASCLDAIVAFIRTGVSVEKKMRLSYAPLLLVVDAVQASDAAPTDRPLAVITDETETPSVSPKLSVTMRCELVRLSVELMKSSELTRNTAHAVWQLLGRITLDYEVASELLTSPGALEQLLNLHESAMFPGYKEMTAALLVQLLESPQVLEQMMEDKIQQAMTKLAERYGPPSQMRITPRVLIMEVAPFAARSEKIFMQALQKTLSFKKTESGRVYVVSKETVAPPSGAQASVATGDGATVTAPQDDPLPGDKEKKVLHKLPKSHRHHAQTIVSMLTDRIQRTWQTEKTLPETQKLEDDEKPTGDTSGVCAGTYLYLLTQVVSTFPACAAVITKHHDATHSSGSIIHFILRELLPCKALCRFATIRRVSLGDETATLGATGRVRNSLTFRTRERLRNAHKLLVAVGTQPGDGPKVIVGELVRLFQMWPASVNSSVAPTEDLSVDDEEALSALHAWSALIMSILWPKGTASKSLSWDKVVLGGGLKGKYAFVTLLVEALRKISLSHPFAYSTCAMLLRPLTTLTRPFVTHRVKKLLKKRSASTGAERDEEVAESAETTTSTFHPLSGSSVSGDQGAPQAEPLESVHSDVDDVAMNSPPDSAVDHEMRDAAGDSDDESERSSMSGRSSDAGSDRRHRHHDEDRDHGEDEEEDDDEDEGEEDEDDDDDEDDDEDDDDEDEEMEEEEGRIRLRMSRRQQEGNTRGRGVGGRAWGALDTEGGGADGFDEVDEDEFSYLRLLDDESFVASQARAALMRQTARTRAASPDASSGSPLLRSLVDMFSLDGGGGGAGGSQVGVFAFGDDDEDEDDPDMAFRHREQGLPQSGTNTSASDVANMGTALANLLEDRTGVSDDNDFIFETVDLGAANSRLGAAARGAVGAESLPVTAGMLHPLLRSSGSASEDASIDRERHAGGLGGLLPDRLPLPRHAPSLFRELNVLVRQMNSNMNFAPGAGTMLGRDLMRHAGGGRNRPPSRNRLSAVSNLLSEFSLDIPTAGVFGHGRQHRGAGASLLRGDRDLLGARGGLRGDWGFDSLSAQLGGGPVAANADARTVAARLEQMTNQLVEADAPTPRVPTSAAPLVPVDNATGPSDSTAAEASSEGVGTSGASGREAQSGSGDGVSEQTQANEAASDTASVIALASSLSLQSPAQDDTSSETEIPTSPQLSSSSTTNATSSVVSTSDSAPTMPPPAPVAASTSGDLLNFTLDLTSFQASTPPQPSAEAAPSALSVVEEEMKTEEEEMTEQPSGDADTGLVCPEGVDPEVFAFLPPDMQAEIIAQHAPPAAQPQIHTQAASSGASGTEGMSQLEMDMANSSFDRETLEALPEDIRAEVLANERREREAAARSAEVPADVSRAEEMDNASFIASLAPGLREEILTTCDDAFLQTLSTQVQAEAMVLRERAAYRPAFYEAARTTTGRGAPADDDTTGDIFRRPTLRRMLTSHGPDIFSAAGRRTGRGRHGGDGSSTRGRGGRDDASHAGMVRVLHDEEEAVGDRILEDGSVKALLRLLFLNKSIVHTRVFQRLLTNVCLYPLTRGCVRVYLMRILSSPLAAPLVLEGATEGDGDEDFPPKELYGTSTGLACGWTSVLMRQSVSPEVLSRVLTVLVTLAKQNTRFAVDILRHHGMLRKGLFPTGASHHESGVEVLIELLEVPVVSRSATHLETLLELLELILLPLSRIARKESDDEEKKENDEDAKPLPTDSADWVHVPHVSMDARRLSNLVSVLTLSICSPTMQERTIQILKLLDRVAANRPLIMSALVHEAKCLAANDRFRCCSGHGSSVFESSAVLKSAQDELTLLRLLHTLSDVCETTSDFNECCATIGLDALWEALSKSLDEARLLSGGAIDAPVAAAVGTPRVADSASAADAQTGEDDHAEGMVIEGKSAGASIAMAALLARFLPMVEAFFVVSARDAATMPLRVPDSAEREEAFVTALRESGLESAESLQHGRLELKRLASVTTSDAGSDGIRLAAFVEANRVLLNLLVREKPSLLDSSLAALVKLPRCRAYLDFDNKRTYFQSAMKKLRHTALRSQVGNAAVRLAVRRDHIFEDSYYALRMRSGAELRRKLHISFTGEEGIDAGGVTREWYVILAREIFNPNYVLFTSAADSPTFQPNPLSYVNKDHLSYFEFVGKVIGKAVADGQLLDAHFTRSFYKHILQLPISYHDMEAIDPEYYRNLHSILDNAIEDLGLELTFSAEQSNFGRMEIVDLIPNGRNIAVTDANKMEYVKLVTHHRMATGIRQQIDAFLKGFHQLVPPEMISIFNENELELLISGMPEIDIDDLKANTDYANYKPTDAVIRWFWNVLYSCTHEERALFLQFVTGTSKVPLEGFKALEGMRGTHKFNIHKAFGNPNALPSAHTCFNQLDLPEYESEDKLRQCLLLAIREGSEGFGFG